MGRLDSRLTRLEKSSAGSTASEHAYDMFRRLAITKKKPEDRSLEEERWVEEFDRECERHPRPSPHADELIQGVIRARAEGLFEGIDLWGDDDEHE